MTFDMDSGGFAAFNGYVAKMSQVVKTPAYIGSALRFSHHRLAELFDIWMDTTARNHPGSYHHVYEWPTEFENYRETVGIPAYRLWAHTVTGWGGNQVASFEFLPSKRPTPVDPILTEEGPSGKSVRVGVHKFVWKAPAMEYGIDITVTPQLSKYLAYVYGKQAEKQGYDYGRAGHQPSQGDESVGVQFSIGPVEFQAGGGKFVHNFSNAFLLWWGAIAGQEFDRVVRPVLESDLINERSLSDEIRIGNSTRTRRGTLNVVADRAARQAVVDLNRNKNKYLAASQRRRERLHGEDEE